MMFLRKALLLAVLAATIADASSQEQSLRGGRDLGKKDKDKDKKKQNESDDKNNKAGGQTGGYTIQNPQVWNSQGTMSSRPPNFAQSQTAVVTTTTTNTNYANYANPYTYPMPIQTSNKNKKDDDKKDKKDKNDKGKTTQGSFVFPVAGTGGVIATTWKPSDLGNMIKNKGGSVSGNVVTNPNSGTSYTVNKVPAGTQVQSSGSGYVGSMNTLGTPANVNVVNTYTPSVTNNRAGQGRACASDGDCPGQCCGNSNYGCINSLPKGGILTQAVMASLRCMNRP